MRLKALAGALLVSWAAAALAQTATPPPPPPQWRFEMHGFAGGTVYVQDTGNSAMFPSGGQQALYMTSAAQPKADRLVLGGDVRQSRFNFSVAGPKVWGGAVPKAVLEIDFFNGWGSGGYGDISVTPRMRISYAELNWGNHRLQVGQQNDISFAMAPVSLAHIAFPIGYGTGNIGWRRVGLFGYHTFGDISNKDSTKVEFAWEVGSSNWNDSGAPGPITVAGCATAPCGTVAQPTNGIGQQVVGAAGDAWGNNYAAASAIPAVQARLTLLGGQNYSVFVGGHYSRLDRNGMNVAGNTVTGGISSDMDIVAGFAGLKLALGPLTIAGTGFTGKNLAPLVGELIQFQANTVGDVHEYGFWGQIGLNFTKELSLWAFGGAEVPNRPDAIAAKFTRLQNVTTSALLQYRDGGYAMGLEWVHFHTTTAPAAGFTDTAIDGNQFLFTGLYFF